MTTTAERKRTIEARLDRLRQRLDALSVQPLTFPEARLKGVLRGTLDLLADVLLEEERAT